MARGNRDARGRAQCQLDAATVRFTMCRPPVNGERPRGVLRTKSCRSPGWRPLASPRSESETREAGPPDGAPRPRRLPFQLAAQSESRVRLSPRGLPVARTALGRPWPTHPRLP